MRAHIHECTCVYIYACTHPCLRMHVSLSPPQLPGAVLVDESFVVGAKSFDIWNRVALGVQVILVELMHPLLHLSVLLALKLCVGVVGVPWVEAVIPDDVKTLLRDRTAVALQHVVHILCNVVVWGKGGEGENGLLISCVLENRMIDNGFLGG